MKFEKLFNTSENRLYKLDGTSVTTEGCTQLTEASVTENAVFENIAALNIKWTTVGLNEESYNEEFLATLRDYLKTLEEKNLFVFIVPVIDAPADKEALTASFNHCARRIKDCTSVAGFAIPEEADAAEYMEVLLKKHAHYVFFSRNQNVLSDGTIVKF